MSIGSCPVVAQNVNQNRQKLAETFEANGDYRNAAKIYEELFNSNQNMETYFLGYVRSLYALNQFSDLLVPIEKYLEKNKTNTVYCLYAEVLWKLGKTKEANSAWEKSLESNSKDANTYTATAASQSKLLLFDKSVFTYEQGRKIMNNKQAFADELSKLYIAIGDFKKASEEVLVYFDQTKNIPQTQGRIQAIILSVPAKEYLMSVMKKESKAGQKNYTVLYAWFLTAIGDYEKSLEVYADLDKQLDAKGLEIFNFATARVKDGELDIAMKAYGLIIDLGKNSPYLINALFGYTRAMESKAELTQNFKEKDYLQVIDRYKNMVSLYPNNAISFDAQYRIAMIYKDNIKQSDKAIETLVELQKTAKNQPIAFKASNTLGDIYFAKDNISKAGEYYQIASNTNNSGISNEKDYAAFRLAEFVYFDGQIDSAMTLFNKIAENPESNLANDALEKIFLIEQNKSQNKAIRLFALAEKHDKQEQDSVAINEYREAIESGSGSLVEFSLINIASIYKKMNKKSEQRKIYLEFLEKTPESIFADRICFELAEAYFADKLFDEAMKEYTLILTKYPKSIYLEESRAKIRQIRSSVNS